MKLKIALFDAHTLALSGIHDTLNATHDFEIVGAYAEEKGFLECLEQGQADIAIVDLMLKSSPGMELLEKIKSIQKEIKIIVFTEEKEENVFKRELEIGVNAFLRKDTTYSELINSIVSVGKGDNIIPSFVMNEGDNTILSEMEIKILKLISDEYTSDKIAKELFISRRTVETYVAEIIRKLGVNTRIGAVMEAIKLNLL